MNRLPNLKEKFNGNVFIYASGKSSEDFPLEQYKEEKYIVVNGAVRMFIERDTKPFAFIFDDVGFLEKNIDLVVQAIVFSEFTFMPKELFLKFNIMDKIPSQYNDKIYFINKINQIDGVSQGSYRLFFIKNIFNDKLVFNFSRLLYKSKNTGFSKDITQGYFCARTIPYVAFQLAYYLGFNRVFFVGLDLNASAGRFYDKKDPLPTTLDKDYPRHIYPSFAIVSKRVLSEKFKAYNLSVKSKLPECILPKITLKELKRLINEN